MKLISTPEANTGTTYRLAELLMDLLAPPFLGLALAGEARDGRDGVEDEGEADPSLGNDAVSLPLRLS